MKYIDLALYTADGKVQNLSGKSRGLDVRREFRMDDLDRGTEVISVLIPDYVYAISTSFFCGMFSDSYKLLGREGLLNKYQFKIEADLWPQIHQGLERCSYDFTPFIDNVG